MLILKLHFHLQPISRKRATIYLDSFVAGACQCFLFDFVWSTLTPEGIMVLCHKDDEKEHLRERGSFLVWEEELTPELLTPWSFSRDVCPGQVSWQQQDRLLHGDTQA